MRELTMVKKEHLNVFGIIILKTRQVLIDYIK